MSKLSHSSSTFISPTPVALKKFQRTIWAHYDKHRRSFPWREHITPYRVVVSEIMLQQTQAPRAIPRFESFITRFPDWQCLAKAPTAEVLSEWQGLGYNRRALYLKKIAEAVTENSHTKAPTPELPRTVGELMSLPGIGPNTAGSILAFAWNIPHPFIETNIRTVFIHFFFRKTKTAQEKIPVKINDKDILILVEKTLPMNSTTRSSYPDHPARSVRDWYYALMDYGTMLKRDLRAQKLVDPSRHSKHYKKQSAFRGSNRELRAALLRSILKASREKKVANGKTAGKTTTNLISEFTSKAHPHRTPEAILKNLAALEKEGFITEKTDKNGTHYLPAK